MTEIEDKWSIEMPKKILELGMNYLKVLAETEASNMLSNMSEIQISGFDSTPASRTNNNNNDSGNKNATKENSRSFVKKLGTMSEILGHNSITNKEASSRLTSFDEAPANDIVPFLRSFCLLRWLFEHYISYGSTRDSYTSQLESNPFIGCINISSNTRVGITETIQNLSSCMKPIYESDSTQVVIAKVQQARSALFDAIEVFANAYKEVLHLLESDSMMRFRRTESYKFMLEKLVPLEKTRINNRHRVRSRSVSSKSKSKSKTKSRSKSLHHSNKDSLSSNLGNQSRSKASSNGNVLEIEVATGDNQDETNDNATGEDKESTPTIVTQWTPANIRNIVGNGLSPQEMGILTISVPKTDDENRMPSTK